MIFDDELRPVIGVDLGTAFTSVARWAGDQPQGVRFADGSQTLPSSVYLRDNDVPLVGAIARRRLMIDPANGVESIKRHLGQADFAAHLSGTEYTAEQITAMIFGRIREDLERQFPAGAGFELAGTIVTHPHCFKYPQLVQIRNAAELAGLPLIRLLSEPVAAALSYGVQIGRSLDVEKILVFDLGAGTLDVVVLEVIHEEHKLTYRVCAAGGDAMLGGCDFDDALLQWALQQESIDLGSVEEITRRRSKAKLLEAVIEAKHQLSVTDDAYLTVANVLPDRHLDMEISRAEFNEIIGPHCARIREIVSNTLIASGLRTGELNRIILVGGSSRIPIVRDIVRDETGTEPFAISDPDLAVCKGAALLAAIEDGRAEGSAHEVVVEEATSHALGVQVADGRFSTLIPKNRRVPLLAGRKYRVATPSPCFRLAVSQADTKRDDRDAQTIGTIEVPLSRSGAEAEIEVVLRIDSQQMISFRVNSPDEHFEGMLPLDSCYTSRAPNQVLSESAKRLISELTKASEILPTPMAQFLIRSARKVVLGRPLENRDLAGVIHELFVFAGDCLLASYLLEGRHDIDVVRLLSQTAEGETPQLPIELVERLLGWIDEERLPEQLARLVERLLNEEKASQHILASVAKHDGEPSGSDSGLSHRLCDLLEDIVQTVDGFTFYAGYGDSLYQFRGPIPQKVAAADDLTLEHNECVFANRATDQCILLSPLWQVTKGPSLRRQVIAHGLPFVREWSLGGTRVVLIVAPLERLIVDAITISNDPNLNLGTITSGSVAQAAGKEFRRQLQGKSVKFGHVLATSAGALSAKEIYHACTIGGPDRLTGEHLYQLVREVLRLSNASGHRSVAFPLLGMNYGIEQREIVTNYLRAIEEHLQRNVTPDMIVLCTPHPNASITIELCAALDAVVRETASRVSARGALDAVKSAGTDPAADLALVSDDQAFSSHTVITGYPAPIAVVYRRFLRQQEPRARLEALFYTLEACLRYLTTMALSDLFHCLAAGDDGHPSIPDHKAFDILREPTDMQLGRWLELTRELSRVLADEPGRFVLEFPEVCASNGPWDEALAGWLIHQRNRCTHTDGSLSMTADECREAILRCRPKLEETLHRISFVQSYPLGFVRRADLGSEIPTQRVQPTHRYYVHSCMGARVANTSDAYVVDTSAELQQDIPFVTSRDGSRLLYLWPFLWQRVNDHSGRHTLYVFEGIPERKRKFLSTIRVSAIDTRDEFRRDLREQPAASHAWFIDDLRRRPATGNLPSDLGIVQKLYAKRAGTLVGRYLGANRLRTLVAAGGFGSIYAAETPTGHEVAVKVIESPEAARNFQRFRREFDKLRQAAEHPGVIRCYEYGTENIDGRLFPWYSMEFALGGDLTSRIEERQEKLGEVSPWTQPILRAEVIAEFREVTDAVAFLHGLGVVHRDIKPANVLIVDGGGLRLSDFGLIKSLEPSEQSLLQSPQTSTGAVLGTRTYMAPEQEQGLEVDKSADVYSLGILWAELALGYRPQPETKRKQGSTLADWSRLEVLPRSLRRFVLRCSYVEPEKRPADAACVQREFEQAVQASGE